MENKQNVTYTSPKLEILRSDKNDIISTSGFLGGDDVIFNPTSPSPNEASYDI